MLALSRGLVRRGHTVEIVVTDPPSSEWLQSIELKTHAVGAGLTSYRHSPDLDRWLKTHGGEYERVIVNGMWQYPGLAVWRRFARSATPYYVFPHGMLDPWFKRTYPLKHVKKWLYWPWAEYRILRDAAAVIFTSEQEKDEARESFWLYRAREKVSPLGVEPPPALTTDGMFFERFPQLRQTRPLLFLGRLHPKKGCDLAIDAFAALAHHDETLSLVLAGPDQVGWRNELADKVRHHQLDSRVIFTGMLEGELKQSALRQADAFILPSHQENFGMAVVEALSMGVPVLISDRINTSADISADGAGYVATDDLAGARSLIERWINTSGERKRVMRQNARACYERRFHIDRAVDSLLEILTETSRA